MLFLAPRVFQAPSTPVEPGRCVCRWAAARPRDRHTRACGSEGSISRPALALPPPTGTAARPTNPFGALHTCGAGLRRGRRPARSPSALRAFGSARRIEARPGPATARGHRSLARRFLWASWGSRVLSFWGALVRVVTNVVNPGAFSLIMVVFWLGLTTFVTGVLVRRFELRWFDDVCNVGCPLVDRPGPAAAHGCCSLAVPTGRPGCLKHLSPLLARACGGLKPSSPLRMRIRCFRVQR